MSCILEEFITVNRDLGSIMGNQSNTGYLVI